MSPHSQSVSRSMGLHRQSAIQWVHICRMPVNWSTQVKCSSMCPYRQSGSESMTPHRQSTSQCVPRCLMSVYESTQVEYQSLSPHRQSVSQFMGSHRLYASQWFHIDRVPVNGSKQAECQPMVWTNKTDSISSCRMNCKPNDECERLSLGSFILSFPTFTMSLPKCFLINHCKQRNVLAYICQQQLRQLFNCWQA